jgi:amidase
MKYADAPAARFCLEEATIQELHAAIQAGETTVTATVEHYLARVRAFNGVSSMLVTEGGGPVPETVGTVRGGKPLRFPTRTAKA